MLEEVVTIADLSHKVILGLGKVLIFSIEGQVYLGPLHVTHVVYQGCLDLVNLFLQN